MRDLKAKTLRGGVAKLCAVGMGFLLRILSVTVLARLLSPKDFGLVGMVTAFTGMLGLFRDFGLSAATIQRETVTNEQISTLFWLNLAVGAILAMLTFAMAPVIAMFYSEPRLLGVTSMLALGFLFNSAGVQHGAMLQREMRFTALAVIGTMGSFVGLAIAIVMALAGYGYWSLVIMTMATPAVITVGVWLATSWIPRLPRKHVGLRPLIHFGGAVTLHGLLIYIANNFEKVLVGKLWGADGIGIYGRAYQLNNLPTDTLNSTIGEVAFAALSRLRNEPARLKSYFLKGYALVVSATLPITIVFALFAEDIVPTLLGPRWKEVIPVFRLLSPSVLVFGIVNPMGWLLCSIGEIGRLLKMSFVITPIIIGSYLVAVPYGPRRVAFTCSLVMSLWAFPVVVWGVHDTVISVRDVLTALTRPLTAGIIAGVLATITASLCRHMSVPHLFPECGVFVTAYPGLLLYAMGQKALYVDLWRSFRERQIIPEATVANRA